jgi:hypothetical protein
MALSFAQSQRGQEALRKARQHLDTPANRDKLRQAASTLRAPRR